MKTQQLDLNHVLGFSKSRKPKKARLLLLFLVLIFFAAMPAVATAEAGGTVWQWGSNWTQWSSPVPTEAELTGITAIAGGMEHSLALNSSGFVYAWGFNQDGELGIGTYDNSQTPVAVPGLPTVQNIASGWFHSLALDTTGTLWRWGCYTCGMFTQPTLSTLNTNYPVQVSGFPPAQIKAMAGGGSHSVVLMNDGSVWAWGANVAGQLGDGTTIDSLTPVRVIGLPPNIVSIAAGGGHSLALDSDGMVWAWGSNVDGQLGNGSNVNSANPVQVQCLFSVIALFGGGSHSLALKSDGTVWTWGLNTDGQLGNGINTSSNVPVQVLNLSNIIAIDGECFSSFALKSDGTVWEWGRYYDGSANITSNIPVQKTGVSAVSAIAGGMDQRIVLISSGTSTITITTSSLPDGTVAVLYNQTTLTASGGTPPYSWSIISGSLPPGLYLGPTATDGVISGTPSEAGVFTFTVQATDVMSNSATRPLAITINNQAVYVTATANAHGSISPSGIMVVWYGSTQTFTITPDPGYHPVMSGTCGGTLSGTGPPYTYTTNPVTADCTVIADFAADTYTVTPTAGIAGSEIYEYVTQWAIQGPSCGAISDPYGVALDTVGNVYVGDVTNNVVQKFDSNGNYLTQWGPTGPGFGQFANPASLAVDASGNVYVFDLGYRRIIKFDSNGTYVTKWGSYGTGPGQFYNTCEVAVDASANVYVSDTGTHRIQKFDSNGVYLTEWGSYGSGNGQFMEPGEIAVDAYGNIYVSDWGNKRIQKFDSNGTYLTQWSISGTGNPYGIAIDPSGNIYVTEPYINRIQKYSENGTLLTEWGSYGTGDGQFKRAYDVAVNAQGYVYVGDGYNCRIQKFQGIFPGTSSAGGDISPSTPQTVNYTETTSFVVTPNVGYHIMSVTGCGGTLSGDVYTTGPVTADCTVAASFAIDTYTLTVSKAGTGNGTVESSPGGISCGADCDEVYDYGSIVTLTTTPDAGSVFTGWSGGGCSGTGTCSTTIEAETAVTATFARAITLTRPNGGEICERGNACIISWAYAASDGSVRIELLKNGLIDRIISSDAPMGSNGTGSYNWLIPHGQTPGTNYRITVTSNANPNFTDTSEGYFTIIK